MLGSLLLMVILLLLFQRCPSDAEKEREAEEVSGKTETSGALLPGADEAGYKNLPE